MIGHFIGSAKPLVLNKVNAESIAEIANDDDMDRWAGVAIVLYPTKTEFNGKRVPCIRVEAPDTPANAIAGDSRRFAEALEPEAQ